jgi:hypothetical protein
MTKLEQFISRFSNDYRKAQEVAIAAANANGGEDGGTCNLDGVFIRVPRANEGMLKAALSARGIHISSKVHSWIYGTGYLINASCGGQANRRDRATTAMYNHLKAAGYDVSHWQQMD